MSKASMRGSFVTTDEPDKQRDICKDSLLGPR
jgi:hypothetical protein